MKTNIKTKLATLDMDMGMAAHHLKTNKLFREAAALLLSYPTAQEELRIKLKEGYSTPEALGEIFFGTLRSFVLENGLEASYPDLV
jgi:hypothetical protein